MFILCAVVLAILAIISGAVGFDPVSRAPSGVAVVSRAFMTFFILAFVLYVLLGALDGFQPDPWNHL